MKLFNDLSQKSQVATLRPFAQKFAAEFGLAPTSIRLANHGYNTTFRVESARGTFALRININSPRTLENIRGEIAWTSQLAVNPKISAAIPHCTPTGEYILTSDLPSFDRPLHAVCYYWLPGTPYPTRPSLKLVKNYAETMHLLHENPPQLPQNAELPTINDVILGQTLNFSDFGYETYTPLFKRIFDKANSIYINLQQSQSTQIIHYDLHMGNMKRSGDQIHILDFDDCCYAPPLFDISTAFFYFRSQPGWRKREAQFWKFFPYSPPDFGVSWSDWEYLIASRRLLLANEILTIANPEIRALTPKYTEATAEQFQRLEQDGTYSRLDAPD